MTGKLIALAQRGILQSGVSLSSMNTDDTFQAHMTVEAVLQKWPETWAVFKAQRTDCIGCFMQRFCTLQEVAETYQLPLESLLNELRKCISASKLSQRSTL
jgi:hybrid cluster-associated redox disulfide protein